jgi:hypothetical protein
MNEKTYDVIAHFRHYSITQTQIDACTRKIDPETKQVFYEVKSATTPGTVYKVWYDRRFGRITCNCPAFTYPTCWHRRAAVKAEELFKADLRKQYEEARAAIESSEEYRMEISQATAEQARASYLAAIKAQAASGDEAAKRELRAYRRHGEKAYNSEGFSLLK